MKSLFEDGKEGREGVTTFEGGACLRRKDRDPGCRAKGRRSKAFCKPGAGAGQAGRADT